MFKHLPVGKKIASIFSCIVALLVAVAFLISAEIDLVRKEIVNLTDSTLPSVAQVEALRYELSTIRTGQYAILTYEDEHQAYQHIERVDRQVLMVNQMLKRMTPLSLPIMSSRCLTVLFRRGKSTKTR
ncbi:methyl-accepting chemotaxis protein [Photobacterium aphoticum]|uniref:Methyl-accepting chemotaxis protein n=1 Tax=Photobacterium aphoticum TaxID=754436 RepID=A0A090R937_9GAMM|nr:methyl-accepting chemotaxis protein [Photobacterium aphoticum]